MGLTRFLAATAGELSECKSIAFPIAWMACHFSSSGAGISNLPQTLPRGSLILLDDSMPFQDHDPQKIAEQLLALSDSLHPKGFILDFQRQNSEENKTLAKFLAQTLPCPVAVSDLYAESLSGPVFLSTPPLWAPLKDHIVPWSNREIWLEAVHTQEVLTLTQDGCHREETIVTDEPLPYKNEQLHCQYDFCLEKDRAVFTLRRTEQELSSLLHSAESFGITTAISLYQQTKSSAP